MNALLYYEHDCPGRGVRVLHNWVACEFCGMSESGKVFKPEVRVPKKRKHEQPQHQ